MCRKRDTMRYEQDVEHVESTLKLSQGDRIQGEKERRKRKQKKPTTIIFFLEKDSSLTGQLKADNENLP